jgi:RNA polymerase sigma-70 factor (ECF subfamily)
MAEARAGSSEALGRLLTDCREYLLLLANRKLATELQGKVSPSDLVQETFLEAQRDFGRFQGGCEDELLAWLSRVLVNNLANVSRSFRDTQRRELGREVPLHPPNTAQQANDVSLETPSPGDKAVAREELAVLERALSRLSERYRQAIRLRLEERLTFEQVGDTLGCSADAARKLWARAVDQLRKEMGPPHELTRRRSGDGPAGPLDGPV